MPFCYILDSVNIVLLALFFGEYFVVNAIFVCALTFRSLAGCVHVLVGALALFTRCWMEMATFVFCLLSWMKTSLSPTLSATSATSYLNFPLTIITLILTEDTEFPFYSCPCFIKCLCKKIPLMVLFVLKGGKCVLKIYCIQFSYHKRLLIYSFYIKFVYPL